LPARRSCTAGARLAGATRSGRLTLGAAK